ncbi:MAG: cytochrome c3 family protein [Desulfobulbales bacterium]
MKIKTCFMVSVFIASIGFCLFSIPVHAIENDECMECHSDKALERKESEGMKEDLYIDYNRFKYSVHNVNGVTCVDCHSDIEELNWDNEVPHSTSLAMVKCDYCHEEEGKAYLDSVHKKAGGKGITIPCYACHGYHFVTHLDADSVFQRENQFCLKCHNPDNFHEWLPQKDNHFAFVECAVCHAPDSPRYISLRFYDLISNKFLTTTELLKALDTNYDDFMIKIDTDRNDIISLDELEDMVLLLRQKDIRGTFHGELVMKLVPTVHHINRGGANRECAQCHNPQSPFFEEVFISLYREDGTSDRHKVERRVLESYYVNHFYAIGGTRVRYLDKIGLILLACGLSVVVGHLFSRIATAPIRRKRKTKKDEFSI